jgi:hypothetical protein
LDTQEVNKQLSLFLNREMLEKIVGNIQQAHLNNLKLEKLVNIHHLGLILPVFVRTLPKELKEGKEKIKITNQCPEELVDMGFV